MAGGIYKRGNVWWAWWTETVKDPKTGRLRKKQKFQSSQSAKRTDAVTLLSTKVHEAKLQKPRPDLPDPTYEEVRDLWLKHREAKLAKKGQKPEVRRDGTVCFAGRQYLDEFFAGWKAGNIDTPDIEELQTSLLNKGLGNGIDRMTAALRAMLRYAVKMRRLHPAQLPLEFPMVRKERTEPEPIDEKFFEPLCRELPEPHRTAFVLAWHTGMRLSEIERLQWQNVFLEQGKLRFHGAKTGKRRDVPLLANTAKLLSALPQGKPTDLVFPDFVDKTARARAWRHAAVSVGCGAWYCRKCNAKLSADMKCPEHGKLIEREASYRGPLFRYTRHTLIRRLTNMGVPTVRIMQMVGHENMPTNLRYNVADEEDLDLIRKAYGD